MRKGMMRSWNIGHSAMLAVALSMAAGPARTSQLRAAEWTVPTDHPRLLIHRDAVADIRKRCGLSGTDAPTATGDRLAGQRQMLERLQAAARGIMRGPARTDDLYAPALLHLLTGDAATPDEFSRYVGDSLLHPDRRLFGMDALVALDWCWDALTPDTRRQIIQRLPLVPDRFSDAVSPLDHLGFESRLCGLAQAVVCYDPAGPADDVKVFGSVISAGHTYLSGPFVEFCRQRGTVPTSGRNGVWEEADYTLAIELMRTGLGHDLWPRLSDSIGRALEHYFYADTDSPELPHGFIHDDGSEAPPRPGLVYRGFVPVVPFVLARQARDPVAMWYAARGLPRVEPTIAELERYAWAALVYHPADTPEAARRACPLGRYLGGGWVAMRTGWAPAETVLLFDAGQPFWRSRQHFDAGHFLIYRKGRLAIQSGDDVTFEAVPAKGGQTLIGEQVGDWDHYFQSTLAHNCVTVASPSRRESTLYGRPWPAAGNQRLIGHDYAPELGDLEKSGRITGHLTAFETNSFYTYAAADLTAAYPAEVMRSMVRHVLMVNAGMVVVVDRLECIRDRSVKTWHLQLPSRPDVINGAKQVFGVRKDAGIWQLQSDQSWMKIDQAEGSLLVQTIQPANATRRVVGGPGHSREISGGLFQGIPYFGSEAKGFQYYLAPAVTLHAASACYSLERPTSLGAQFGNGAAWGRYDVSVSEPSEATTFVHVLVPIDRSKAHPPSLQSEQEGSATLIEAILPDQRIRLRIDSARLPIGRVTIADNDDKTLFEKELSTQVHPNRPIPTASSSSRP